MLRERFPITLLADVAQCQSFFSLLALGDWDAQAANDADG
jgi:hypothetical protein